MKAALQRVERDAQLRGSLRGTELLDVAEQDDLAMDGIEVRERCGEELAPPDGRDGAFRIGELGREVVLAAVEPCR